MNKLWVDKYRPRDLNDFISNESAKRSFNALSQSTDISHMIVEGISGIGKKSFVMAFLKKFLEHYGLDGDDIYKTQNVTISLKYPNKKIDLHIQKSLYHYNLNPSDYNIYDRHIVQDFLKSQLKYKSLTGFPYKFVIIRNAEKLSLDAQQSLRRTLENCIRNCRFIFMVDTENRGGLISPLLSRCIRIRLSCPSKDEAVNISQNILKSEGFQVQDNLIKNLYKKCGYNLTKTINLLQLMSVRSPQLILPKMKAVNLADVDIVTKTCHEILHLFNSHNISSIIEIRTKLYVLLTHGISPEEIMKRIFYVVLNSLPGMELEIVQVTNQIEEMLNRSSREFYHLENYIVHLLILVKSYQPNSSRPIERTKPTTPKVTSSAPREKQSTSSISAVIPTTISASPGRSISTIEPVQSDKPTLSLSFKEK